ncbi:MAG TPA: PQQ-binding-like beta-propeller repeat protein [Bryobacteraceae bacterium]|nr:PQQ-binding-like beta-propeller repeat protein [Bryobacteraceae bacterium]
MRIAIWLALALVAHAQNWPSFRGPDASGVAPGKAPLKWDAPKGVNVIWKTPIPGLAHSSPIVWGGRVYVSTAVSSDPKAVFRHGLYGDVEPSPDTSQHSWRVYALDKATGKIIWERVAHEGVPKTKRHPKSSQASCTPATDGKHVVAFFGSEGLYTYDADGKLLWKQDLGALNAGWFYDPDYEWGVASSPIIYKNLVIVQCDIQKNSFIAAFDINDGHRVWLTSREEIPSWGTPTIYDGKPRPELITHATKFIRAYDPMTGKELWRLSGNSEVTAPTPVIAHDLIYITNGYRVVQPIFAIRAGGSGDISLKGDQESSDFIAWSKKHGGPYMATPIVYGDYLYTCGMQGILACYNAKTGERLYQQRLGEGGAYSASPVAADGKIYLSSEDGDILVVKAGPAYELLATNPIGEVLMATPAISDGVIFVRAEHDVFAIGERPMPSK